ncbi:hypothetical protein K1719_008227 [Acacia pycnantha]|nr:hypothetical protein K1719_008227 [Acacia pycnantha]
MEGEISVVSVETEASLVRQMKSRVGHVKKVGNGQVRKIISKKRKPCRGIIKQAVPRVPKALQELYVSCRETFKGPGTVPLPEDVHKLCHILDKMRPEDVGLDLRFFKPENMVFENARVISTTIYECKNFSLCIFFLPAKGVIPLHNHPGMTVFSKLLVGKMHIKSYDWADPDASKNSSQPSQLRLAKLKANRVFTAPCDTSVLYPTTGGNIHEFTAITPSVVLDVLGPPYSQEDGRDCSYYKDHSYTALSNEESEVGEEEKDGYGWLEEIEIPENFQIEGIEYRGPPVIDPSLI